MNLRIVVVILVVICLFLASNSRFGYVLSGGTQTKSVESTSGYGS